MTDVADYVTQTDQVPHAYRHESGGDDEIDLSGLTLPDHASRHQDGGADEVDVTGLAGELADEQDAGKIKGVEVDDTDIGADKILQFKTGTGNLEYEPLPAAGSVFTDRGDPLDYDYGTGDLTTDGTWNDLDLSAIVPSGAKFVVLRLIIRDNVTTSYFAFRKNGNVSAFNMIRTYARVANVNNEVQLIIPCDTNRVVEYLGSPVAFAYIGIVVMGWIS